MNYKRITTQTFEEIVVAQRKQSVLVFGAEWSGNSEIMDSVMERISQEFDSDINFFKVDVEKEKEIAHFFGIHAIPSTIVLRDGEVVDFIKGFISASKIRRKLKAVFAENIED